MKKYYCDRCESEMLLTSTGKHKTKEHFYVSTADIDVNGYNINSVETYLCKKCFPLVKAIIENVVKNKDIGPFKPKL